jgi:hypothetical protein
VPDPARTKEDGEMNFSGICLACLLLAGVVPAAAQTDWQEIQPKRTRDYDDRKSEGYCAIRVWVDDLVIIHTRGDRVAFETVRGQRARDAGTECSQPMPAADALADFKWRGIDGRGRVELLEEPDRRNRYTAIVRIEDTRSGGQEHHFRLTWRNLRPGSGSSQSGGDWGRDRDSNWRPGSRSGAGGRQGSGALGGGSNWQEVRSEDRGRGTLEVSGQRQQQLTDARLEIRQDGEANLEFRGGANPRFRGRVTEQRGDEYTIRLDRVGFDDADGEARVQMRRGRISRIELRGEERRNRNTFSLNFQAN